MWNFFRYGQKRYNENNALSLAGSAALSFTSTSSIGATLAGSASLVFTGSVPGLTKTVKFTATPLIRFTQASQLLGAGGALLEGDELTVSFVALGRLEFELRGDSLIGIVAEATLVRDVQLAAASVISFTPDGSLDTRKQLLASPSVVSISAVAPLKVDVVMAAEPMALSMTSGGRLANTLNVFAVAISAATAAASLSIGKNLAGSVAISFSNASGRLPTVLAGNSSIQLQCVGALRSAGLSDIDGGSLVSVTVDGAFKLKVPLAGTAAMLRFIGVADLARYNNKTLAGAVPLTLVAAGTGVAKQVSLAADAVLQIGSAGTVRMLDALRGAASISFAQSGLLFDSSGFVASSSLKISSGGALRVYPMSMTLADVTISDVVIYAHDYAVNVAVHAIDVEVVDGSIAVEAEVFFIDVREAA